MREIIIASANRNAAEHIKSILQTETLFVSEVLASGAEVLSYASIRPGAVVICGKLSDLMSAISLAEMLPVGFDIVWLVPSGEAAPGYLSNMITLNMPLNRMEFLTTVRTLASSASESFERKKTRNDDENDLLTVAKKQLMEQYSVSEREAHKMLQKKSMETGIRLLDVAKLIIDEE